MPFCKTEHDGVVCGKRFQPDGRCLESTCLGHCSKKCRVIDGHSPDIVYLAQIAARKSEKSGKGATKTKQAIVTAGREQGKSVEEIAEGVQLAVPGLVRRDNYDSDRRGTGAVERGDVAEAEARDSGMSEDEIAQARVDALGQAYVDNHTYLSDRYGAGAGQRGREAEAKARDSGMSEAEAIDEGNKASGNQYQLKRTRLAADRVVKRYERAVRMLAQVTSFDPNADPLPDMIESSRRVIELAEGRFVDQRLNFSRPVVVTAAVVPANTEGPRGVRPQLFEMLQGILGRAYSRIRIRLNRAGRPIMTLDEFITHALRIGALVYEITPNTLSALAFKAEAEAQAYLIRFLARLLRGFAFVGVGGGGPALRAVAVGALRMDLLEEVLEYVDDSTREELTRANSRKVKAAKIRRDAKRNVAEANISSDDALLPMSISSSVDADVSETVDEIEARLVDDGNKNGEAYFDQSDSVSSAQNTDADTDVDGYESTAEPFSLGQMARRNGLPLSTSTSTSCQRIAPSAPPVARVRTLH